MHFMMTLCAARASSLLVFLLLQALYEGLVQAGVDHNTLNSFFRRLVPVPGWKLRLSSTPNALNNNGIYLSFL